MQRSPWTAGLVLTLAAVGAGSARAAEVGVSVQISQPGVFGRIDIGRFGVPQVVVPEPVIIARPAVILPQPIYMWVPAEHRADWRHHCREYRACGVPVYFVHDGWYGEHVRPQGHGRGHGEGRRDDRGEGHGEGHGEGRGGEGHREGREEGRGGGQGHERRGD
jgi:hypothetical protein